MSVDLIILSYEHTKHAEWGDAFFLTPERTHRQRFDGRIGEKYFKSVGKCRKLNINLYSLFVLRKVLKTCHYMIDLNNQKNFQRQLILEFLANYDNAFLEFRI